MGKTVPTYRNQLEAEVRELLPFRRALRESERALFDSLINHARSHSAEGSFTAHPDPIVPFFLSMLLEQERRIRELVRKIDDLVAAVDSAGATDGAHTTDAITTTDTTDGADTTDAITTTDTAGAAVGSNAGNTGDEPDEAGG
jgi:hypothetical protein